MCFWLSVSWVVRHGEKLSVPRRSGLGAEMVQSILRILATLIPWIGRYFSPERKLERLTLKEVKREAEAKLQAEKLKRQYDQIERDVEGKRGKDLLDRLNRQ